MSYIESVIIRDATTGDSAIVDATGALKVTGTLAVTGGLTDAELRATPVPVSGTVTITPSGTQDVNIAQFGAVAISQGQALMAASMPVVIASNQSAIPVSGTVAISGTVDTELPAAVALSADDVVSPTAPAVGAFGFNYDGSKWDRVRGDSTDGLLVNLGANNDVAVTGTVTAAAQPGVDIGDVTVNNGIGANAVNIQDGGNSITVDNAVLSVVGGGTEALAQRVTIANDSTGVLTVSPSGGTMTVDNGTLSVVGGGTEATALRVTIANDSTGVLSIDDNGGSITIDGTVAVSSITNSVTPGTAAAHLGKAEDAPHATGDTGVMLLGVRNDSLATSFSGTDGDYTPIALTAKGEVFITANSAIPVSGTVTAAAQPGVDIGDVTINNAAGASAVNIQDGGNSITIDGTVAVTGVSTIVEQQTQTTHLATIAGDTTNIETSVQLMDDVVATLGTTTYTEATTKANIIGVIRRDANTTAVNTDNEIAPLQVNSTGDLKVAQILPLPAGTNAIGKLAANSGIDIGDVDVTSIIPGTGATNLGKAGGGAHTSGDTGVAVLAVRNDALATTFGADQQYSPIAVNSKGALFLDAGKIEDEPHTSGDRGLFVMGVANEGGAAFVGANTDYAPIATDKMGQVYVNPENNKVLFRGRSGSFRTLGRAGTAGQKILAIHNATGSSITVKVTKITVDMWCTVVKAITVAPPIIRIWKYTVVPSNGTALTKNKIGGTTTSSASCVVTGDASADGTGSGTTLTVTLPAGTIVDQKVAPRVITAAGEIAITCSEFIYEKGIQLAALEGICVFLDYTLATQNPVTDMWVANIEWEEVTT